MPADDGSLSPASQPPWEAAPAAARPALADQTVADGSISPVRADSSPGHATGPDRAGPGGSTAAGQADAGQTDAGGPEGRARQRWRRVAEHVAVLAGSLLVLAVHDVGYLLRHPYWNDEAWVAVTTRFPLSQLPATTSSTPIGWSLLVRLVTVGSTQSARLLPLAFCSASVVAAYWFARRLPWRWPAASVAAGVTAGLATLLVPAMLLRNDLKQYTTEVFSALLVLALTAGLERQWSRRRLAVLSVSVWFGMLFSNAVAFIGVAAFTALALTWLARRDWRRLVDTVVAGAVTGALMLVVYELFVARAVAPLKGSAYWPHFYIPLNQGLHASLAFVLHHFHSVQAHFGLGPIWLAATLAIAGVLTMLRLGVPATALVLPLVWLQMLALSALRIFPFLNPRTSTFLIVLTVVVAATGVIGVCSLLRPWLKGAPAAVLAAAAVAAFAVNASPYLRAHSIANEDVRDQALYVAAHAAPQDVILVNLNSNWGFAYYWPIGQPARRPDNAVKQLYEAYFPGQPRIIVARNRDAAGVDAALSQALSQARRHGCSRIWLVRTHLIPSERAAWAAALAQRGLSATAVGGHGLSMLRLRGASCR